MQRRWIPIGGAGLLAFVLSMGSFAGSVADTDGDGVPDAFDNCITIDNGPLQATVACNAQEDAGIVDGYGNPCDSDANNDGAAGLDDLATTFGLAATVSTNPNYDYDCDGAVGLSDVAKVFADCQAVTVPGPSGLACAGVGPYPCVAE